MVESSAYDVSLIRLIASSQVQEFLLLHQHDEPSSIPLRFREVSGVSGAALANQIKCRQKARTKLPEWYATAGIVYPPSVNLEQSSSQATGSFKQALVHRLGIGCAADLTGGFGVDSYYLSKACAVETVEPNENLLNLAKHNHRLLGAKLRYHNTTAEKFLESNKASFDLIFADPSRRSDQQQRLWKLADGTPNVPLLQAQIFEAARWLLVKASPLQDIQQGLRELRHVAQVLVVAVDNECKELLFLSENGFDEEPLIRCYDLAKEGNVIASFDFRFSEEHQVETALSEPATYLYEPTAAIMKGGAFKMVAHRFGLSKLAPHTHLYTSQNFLPDFPGRAFEILEEVKPSRALRQQLPNSTANILVRNYPLSVQAIKKQTGLSEGGDLFLIGCSSTRAKHLFIARRRQ